MTKTITMLGLDPSLTHTGWAVSEIDVVNRRINKVLDWGTVVTAPTKTKSVRRNSDDLFRARTIRTTVVEVIDRYGIKIGASEVPSGAQSARAALSFGISVGLLAALPIPLIEVMPSETKLATHGTKTADKEDIVRWVLANTQGSPIEWPTGKKANDWGIEHNGGYIVLGVEHQADAVAVTEAAIKSEQFRQIAGMVLSFA
jgi:Holliday junction resolvasome RuvABC endonuclease subunit